MNNVSLKALGLVAVVALAVVLTPALRSATADQAAAKPSFVLNITSGSEDLHSVTMALQLAGHALDDGRDVSLFFNVRGPELARADLSEKVAFHGNPPIRKMIASLQERGATVIACPHCMEVLGVTADDLLPGARVATRELLFGKLPPGAVVFTY